MEGENPAVLEPDNDVAVDTDSAYGDTAESTKSLSSSVLAYTYENGRRYHAFREGEYVLPNDEREQDRLDLLHHIFKLILRGSVVAAPIHKHVQRVLDIGTGTGIWAIDFADEHPAAEVIGIDLSPIQPTWIPPNCMFVVDDAEEDWLYTPGRAFDYIHGRAMGGSISNWPKLYAQIYKHLKPGCWVEMQEYETEIVSDDGTLDNAVYVKEWQETVNAASVSFGKEFNVAGRHKQRMIDAGFLDVTDEIHKVPVGPWARDPKAKEIGRYELVHMLDAVEPFTLALFTRTLGWSREKTEVLMAGVRADFTNSKNHLYSYFHFVYGRKPETTK